jgi:hypothetical protein
MNLKNKSIIFFMAIALATGCLHEPVDEEYYNDLAKIKGGQKPTPPILNYNSQQSLTIEGHTITLKFWTDTGETYDPDTGTNENLYYLVYISATDPALFTDPKLYYDIRYYVGYVAETDFDEGLDPKVVTIKISS